MELTRLFSTLVKNRNTAMDIGAFEGELSLLFSDLVGPGGKVYSFELHPSHFLELSKRAFNSAHKNIFPYCKAISDVTGHRPIYLAPPATAKSSTVVPGLGTEDRLGPGIETCYAETQTLDDFVRSASCAPDFIKIDTEGAERLVFSGAKRVFEIMRPLIVFEGYFGYFEQQRAYCFNEPVPAHVAELETMGYNIYLIDIDFFRGDWVLESSPAYCMKYQLLSISAPDFKHLPVLGCNLLAVHRSRLQDIQLVETLVSATALEYIGRYSPLY